MLEIAQEKKSLINNSCHLPRNYEDLMQIKIPTSMSPPEKSYSGVEFHGGMKNSTNRAQK